MFKWFKKQEKQKEVAIVAIHGFGIRRTLELEPIIEPLCDYEIIRPVLFNPDNENDSKMNDWIFRADQVVSKAINNGQKVILLGFSMGGVIATHLATKYQVEKLILLAPAFEYRTVTTATSALTSFFSQKETNVEMPTSFTQTFMELVDKYKGHIDKVKCPTLIISASNDEVISSCVSSKYYKKLKTNKKHCVILEGGEHRILDNKQTNQITINLIKNFINDLF